MLYILFLIWIAPCYPHSLAVLLLPVALSAPLRSPGAPKSTALHGPGPPTFHDPLDHAVPARPGFGAWMLNLAEGQKVLQHQLLALWFDLKGAQVLLGALLVLIGQHNPPEADIHLKMRTKSIGAEVWMSSQ